MARYKITALPLFADNYSYILEGTSKGLLVLIDPACSNTVLSYLSEYLPTKLVSHVLYTHRHWDHAGQSFTLIPALSAKYPPLEVYAGILDANSIPGVTTPISQECVMKINDSQVKIFLAPCHTRGHVLYQFTPPAIQVQYLKVPTVNYGIRKTNDFLSNRCIFTGDTLFSGGIGKFFQGNAQQMHQILNKINSNVTDQVDIYCGHEYTLHNLRWSSQVQTENQVIQSLWKELQAKSLQGELCTIPTNLHRERQINIFYRAALGITLKQKYQSSIEALRVLRKMKDQNKIAYI